MEDHASKENGDVSTKRKAEDIEPDETKGAGKQQKIEAAKFPEVCQKDRLHYRWAQLEADRSGVNIGSLAHPLPKAQRKIRLHPDSKFGKSPLPFSERPSEKERFAKCCSLYKTIEYNTFCRNSCLKLTEIELFFLSSIMTKITCSEWVVVYLGIGCGDRFRSLRDTFFPELSVVGFDPMDQAQNGFEVYAQANAKLWNLEGSNFILHLRCFDVQSDAADLRQRFPGKQIALISDIHRFPDGDDWETFDNYDETTQWTVMQSLCPISSLVKFAPDFKEQFFEYAPGEILKHVFDNFGACEVRLLITGCPQDKFRYNGWELCEKMLLHHNQLRGQVYWSACSKASSGCMDHCFDCSVLWETVSTYASQNDVEAKQVLATILKHQMYTPTAKDQWTDSYDSYVWRGPKLWERWKDVQWCLQKGRISEAIAALEVEGEVDTHTDWKDMSDSIETEQPEMSARIDKMWKPATRADLIERLRNLASPLTIVYTEHNGLLGTHNEYERNDYEYEQVSANETAEEGKSMDASNEREPNDSANKAAEDLTSIETSVAAVED